MRLAKVVALLGLAAMTGIIARAFMVGNFSAEGNQLLAMPWGVVSLVDALALLEAIPSLPRCGCGKIVHETPDSAQRHVRLLSLINARPPAGDLPPLGIYGDCPVRRHPGWHVGHHAERR